MIDFISIFPAAIAAGDSVETVLTKLRQMEGAHPAAAIKRYPML